MGIATLRRHTDEPVRDVQPGLVSREDHERVVRDLEDRFAVEVAALKKQIEDAKSRDFELNEYKKKDLEANRTDVDTSDARIDTDAVARGGVSVPSSEGTTTVGDKRRAVDGTKAEQAGPTGDTGKTPQHGDPERVKRDVDYKEPNRDPRETSLKETPPDEPSLDEDVHGKKQTQKQRQK